MPTPEAMTAAVHAYVAAFDRADPSAVRDLFAANATVEDPVGSPPHVGHDAIYGFYAKSMETGAKLHLEGPVRIAGNSAAFAFSVKLAINDSPMQIDVIDVFEFNDAGKVVSMRAYFGPGNFSQGAAPHA
ncbi:steroid delta-isomerase [Sphingomonas paeninsulae]|jgi:steroid delta-isomerase|uniref:Steroid delta-isomerase n=1 Tax=Sphingomonas paeninsulae TaxID=2319844 RepID=A0A494TC79_SPHPE|nr:nuclear transport factor 2 family protein [Sphingomonas paeninsulae]AYJ87069.1 steroid delta-isomerase [Sphingomonas paeninsulae]